MRDGECESPFSHQSLKAGLEATLLFFVHIKSAVHLDLMKEDLCSQPIQ
jgi:hypothetical protein